MEGGLPMKALLVALPLLLLPAAVYADDALPLDEANFVEAIKDLPKAKIVELLGEPASAIEVKDHRTGELIGYAWNYNYLNTSDDGKYYKSTELDLVGDRVVTIVFSNGKDSDNTDNDATPEEDALPQGECAPSC
jgi:hypothetical protein